MKSRFPPSSWDAFAHDLGRSGYAIVDSANLKLSEKGFADEKFLAMTLLARTLSNMKGAILLLRAKRIVEARTLARCCFENAFWLAGLLEDGPSFTTKMLNDEMRNRRSRGEFIFKHELPLDAQTADKLRDYLNKAKNEFPNSRLIKPQDAVEKTALKRSYIFYSQLSSDSAHPSIDSLNRYVVPHQENEIGGIDLEPLVTEAEIDDTFQLLCLAVLSSLVATNQILGFTAGGNSLEMLAEKYMALQKSRASDPPTNPP